MFVILFAPFIIALKIMGKIPFKIDDEPLVELNVWFIFMILLFYTGCCFFTYAIYLFRKTLLLISEKIIFDDRVVKILNNTGRYLLAAAALWIIPSLVAEAYADGPKIGLAFNGFNTGMLVVSISVFFMVLSEIMRIAITIKAENDLTL
ncbi:DUF2975 domain-containing protein [Flavobacterium rivuli]|nr:DUF2975 domain-containing protein [Flavobacterium rivuli]